MIITITTDASYSSKFNVGTYAFWITCNNGRYKISGQLKHPLHCSSQAEMKCICNAMQFVVNNPNLFNPITRLIINTDSLNSIHLFTDDTAKIRRYKLNKKSHKNILKTFKLIKEKIDKPIIFSHVKAHKHTNTPVNFVNDWCDKEAKAQMKLKLETFNKKKP